MNPQPPIEPVTDESRLTPELVERVTRLDPVARPQPAKILSLPADESEGTPEEIRQSCREEIQRRLDSIDRGEMKTYTIEETFAYIDSLRKRRVS